MQNTHANRPDSLRYDPTVTLVPARQHDDDIESLRSKLAALEAALTQRAVEIARIKADLETFRIRYRMEVGSLHEELDDLQRAIAEAELDEISRRRGAAATGETASARAPRPESPPRFTSDAVRKLFRDVAKVIHPDLARDELARDRRHSLMIEANRAYALGDEERLRWVLDAWQRSAEAVQGSDPGAMRERLVRRIAHIEGQLNVYEADLAQWKGSPLWQLKALVDESSARGKDLMAEMVRRLKRDIMAARNRLDAIHWSP